MNWSEFVDFWNRTKDIYDEKRDDGEKHREVACRAAQQGKGMERGVRYLGYAKEYVDKAYKKSTPHLREKWGGAEAIDADSEKDLKNNEIGFSLGRGNPRGDCRELSKRQKSR